MSNHEKCDWVGRSGTRYTYFIRPLPARFKSDQPGNYIYSKVDSSNRWLPIYIGQGDLGARVSDQHHQAACIRSKGATHVHVHLNSSELNRLSEERDLLENHPMSYQPNGCNEKRGG